jgi:signal transduction histidine kinase
MQKYNFVAKIEECIMKKLLIISIVIISLIVAIQWTLSLQLRKTTSEKVCKVATLALDASVDWLLEADFRDCQFSCGMPDDTTFSWKGRSIPISSIDEFFQKTREVTYDHLFEHQMLDWNRLDSAFRQELVKYGVEGKPVLVLKDGSGKMLYPSEGVRMPKWAVWTNPVPVGLDCRHQVVAALPATAVFQQMQWALLMGGVFFLGVVYCLFWHWKITRNSLRQARVQTEGVAHLEHEWKKPLEMLICAVKGFAERQEGEWRAGDRDRMELVCRRLERLRDLTNSMLYALRAGKLELREEWVEVRQVFDEVASAYHTVRPEVKLGFVAAAGCEEAKVDPVYFKAMLVNLIDNGIKYNNKEAPSVAVDFCREAENWVLRVSDDGIGIPKRELQRIFKRFYRVKTGKKVTGFGLGLAFVKQVVDAYSGKIEVDSVENKGSVFTVKLPVYE